MAVCQNLVPLVNIKIAGKWMFIPLKMVLIGIDPYPYMKSSCGPIIDHGPMVPVSPWELTAPGIDHDEAEISSQFRDWLEVPLRFAATKKMGLSSAVIP